MRRESNVWMWILFLTLGPLSRDTRLGMGGLASPRSFLDPTTPPPPPTHAHTPHVQAQRVWGIITVYKTDFLL